MSKEVPMVQMPFEHTMFLMDVVNSARSLHLACQGNGVFKQERIALKNALDKLGFANGLELDENN